MVEGKKRKINYGTIISTVIAIGVILYFAFSDPDVKNLGSLLREFNFAYIMACLACVLVYVLFEGGIYYVACRRFPGEMTYLRSVKSAFIGFYYSALTPFSSGGQPMQVAYMRKWKVPTSSSTSLMVLSFFFWHICTSIISIVAFISYRATLKANSALLIACIVGILISLICVSAGAAILMNLNIKPIAKFFLKILKKIKIVKSEEKIDIALDKWVDDFKEAFVILKKYPIEMMAMLLLTALKVIAYSSVAYLLYRGFGLSELSYGSILLMQVLLSSAVAFVPTPGASGASEGAFYIFFSTVFINGTTFPAMLLWRGFTYYIFILIGAALNIFDGINDVRVGLKKDNSNDTN